MKPTSPRSTQQHWDDPAVTSDAPPTKPDSGARHFLYAGLLSVGAYLAFFFGCEAWRQSSGPWQVTFTTDAHRHPALVIEQPHLGIRAARIVFAHESTATNGLPRRIEFRSPTNAAVFGEIVFRDTTVLPGTVTWRGFGHEIEFLPRVLILDHREYAWRPTPDIILSERATNFPMSKP